MSDRKGAMTVSRWLTGIQETGRTIIAYATRPVDRLGPSRRRTLGGWRRARVELATGLTEPHLWSYALSGSSVTRNTFSLETP